ncbi:MAG: hypothetical protein ACFE9L_02800 [Candidatus Hodarchaeota archaeon]
MYEGIIRGLAVVLLGAGFLVSSYGVWHLKMWGYLLAQMMAFADFAIILVWPILFMLFPSILTETDLSPSTIIFEAFYTAGIMRFLYYKRELFN